MADHSDTALSSRRQTSILFVCLGNICRSPTAEGVLRRVAARDAPEFALEIDSAGTADYHIGEPPDMRSQQAARRRGIEISHLQARQITLEDFQRFDLILAMDRANLRSLRALQPRAAARARVQLFMDYAAPGDQGRDVPDPYYGDSQAFEQVLDLCEDAARGLVESLQKGS